MSSSVKPSVSSTTGNLSSLSFEFLSTLLMAVRIKQSYYPSHQALEQNITLVYQAALLLYSSIGAFSIKLSNTSVIINGESLSLTSEQFSSICLLGDILKRKKLGGISITYPPNKKAIKKLIILASNSDVHSSSVEDHTSLSSDLLQPQLLTSSNAPPPTDQGILSVQYYAQLILAARKLSDTTVLSSPENPHRIRVVRVIQHLIDLCSTRVDLLLRLALNRTGASPYELISANTCILALSSGYAAGFDRLALLDLGLAALCHPLDISHEISALELQLARVLKEKPLITLSYMRTILLAEGSGRPNIGHKSAPTHPFTRLIAVILTFVKLTTSRIDRSKPSQPWHPLNALAYLYNNPQRFDLRFVDILVNILRAFPTGVSVVLDNGWVGQVHSHSGSSRWDRPIVSVKTSSNTYNIDLMIRKDAQFERRIIGTKYYIHAGGEVDLNLSSGPVSYASHSNKVITADLNYDISHKDTQPLAPFQPVVPIDDLQLEAHSGPEVTSAQTPELVSSIHKTTDSVIP